jgi:hypothetical protein
MFIGSIARNAIAGIALASLALAPLSAMAQGRGRGHANGHSKWNGAAVARGHQSRTWTPTRRTNQSQYDHRNDTKNEWRNLAIGSGLIGVIGLLTKEPTLTFAGGAGALYSAYRYEQDRKSQNQLSRARAYYFSQPYFYRDGRRYDRRTVVKNGQRYYQFVCR